MQLSSLVGALALTCGIAQVASGAVILVTGGDPGEGFAPWPQTVAAVDFLDTHTTHDGLHTVQGVTFESSSPHISLPPLSNAGGNIGFNPENTPDDEALGHIIDGLRYSNAITITISGLDPTKPHRVELFAALTEPSNQPSRLQTVSVTSGSPQQGDNQVIEYGKVYIFRYDVFPTALGQIVLSLDTIVNEQYTSTSPVINAIAVTVPEPATLGLLAAGAMGTLLTRRRGR
jgi:hypothetical protein